MKLHQKIRCDWEHDFPHTSPQSVSRPGGQGGFLRFLLLRSFLRSTHFQCQKARTDKTLLVGIKYKTHCTWPLKKFWRNEMFSELLLWREGQSDNKKSCSYKLNWGRQQQIHLESRQEVQQGICTSCPKHHWGLAAVIYPVLWAKPLSEEETGGDYHDTVWDHRGYLQQDGPLDPEMKGVWGLWQKQEQHHEERFLGLENMEFWEWQGGTQTWPKSEYRLQPDHGRPLTTRTRELFLVSNSRNRSADLRGHSGGSILKEKHTMHQFQSCVHWCSVGLSCCHILFFCVLSAYAYFCILNSWGVHSLQVGFNIQTIYFSPVCPISQKHVRINNCEVYYDKFSLCKWPWDTEPGLAPLPAYKLPGILPVQWKTFHQFGVKCRSKGPCRES